MEDIIKIDSVATYNELFGLETRNPLVAVVDLAKATRRPERRPIQYGIYALYLKDFERKDSAYGWQPYEGEAGAVVGFGPGQEMEEKAQTESIQKARILLFHPDFLQKTKLQHYRDLYTFFGYKTEEALHLKDEERTTLDKCFDDLTAKLERPADQTNLTVLAKLVQKILDNCCQFYERQFKTRRHHNSFFVERFTWAIKDFFYSERAIVLGFPPFEYFVNEVWLSKNYFCDLIKYETGLMPQEYFEEMILRESKKQLKRPDYSIDQIARLLGFREESYFIDFFKEHVGMTPGEYRYKKLPRR